MEWKDDGQHVHCTRCNKFYGDEKLFREHHIQRRCQTSQTKKGNLFVHFNPSMLRMHKKEEDAKSETSEMEGDAVESRETANLNDGLRVDTSAEAVGNANDCEPQAGFSPGDATPSAPTGSGEDPEIFQGGEEIEEVGKEEEGKDKAVPSVKDVEEGLGGVDLPPISVMKEAAIGLPGPGEDAEVFLQERRLVHCYMCLKYYTGLRRFNEHVLLCEPVNPVHGEWGDMNLNELNPTWDTKMEDESKASNVTSMAPRAPVNPYSILAPLRLSAPKRKAPFSPRIWIRPTHIPIRDALLTREYLATMPGQVYNFPNENLLSPFEFQGKKCWLCLACCMADTFTPEPKPSMVSCACCRDRYHIDCVHVPESFRSPWYCRRCIVKAGLLDQAAVP